MNHIPKLYDRDFDLWVSDTVAKLKARQFHELDLENLIGEVESLAKRDRREVENCLDVLLNHLLKRCYVDSPENYRGWEITIREQRKQLQRLLKQSPSFQAYFAEVFDAVWRSALADAQEDYPQVEFPAQWPFSREADALLVDRFWQN
ncbi:MAG: DUF29 domain-containing protein [Leptolyngbyaceae cyanobacterium SM1_3_5]|nr:DUF29 domain-containing protein [Leptolyngbyaceae cyanobacterium SM1_3_5]